MNTEQWKSFAFSLLGLVSGLCLFYYDQKPVKGLCSASSKDYSFFQTTDDMRRFSKEFPLRAYTYQNV